MTFLHAGLAIAAASAVSIPIIIHLLMRRRRRPVMWGAMRFLLEAYRKHRRRLQLEKWLLLLTRCLVIGLAGLAIARPLLSARGLAAAGSSRTLYLLIDNSLASGAADESGRTSLDRHKEAARTVLSVLGAGGLAAGSEGDRVALISLGGPAEGLVVPASSDAAGIAAMVDALTPTDSRADLHGALSIVASTVEAERTRTGRTSGAGGPARGSEFVVLVSDYLEGSADPSAPLPKLPDGVQLLASEPTGTGAANVAIVGAEPLRSVLVVGGGGGAAGGEGGGAGGAEDQVRVQLRRSGPGVTQAGTTQVEVSLDRPGSGREGADAPAARVSRTLVRWRPGEETVTASLQMGADRAPAATSSRADLEGVEILHARLSAAGGPDVADAITADNRWRRPVELRRSLRVGNVSPRRFGPAERVDRLDAGEWLRLALKPSDAAGVEVVDIDPAAVDGARLAGLDAVILARPDLLAEAAWTRLRFFLDGGGLVMVMPPAQSPVHLWADAMIGAFDLPWRLAREARTYDTPAPILSGAPVGGDATAAELAGLLSLIQGELADLARPVTILRALPMEGQAGHGHSLLTLADGTPLVWAGGIGGGSAREGEGGAAGAEPKGAPGAGPGGETRGLLLYLSTALDLSWSDLPARPLMVPLLHELIRQGIGRAHGSWATIAGSRPGAPARTVELRALPDPGAPARAPGADASEPDADALVQIDDTGATVRPLRRAGVWEAIDERGASRGIVAVNPDPRAGLASGQEPDLIRQWLGAAVAGAGARIGWLTEGPVAAAGEARGLVQTVRELLAINTDQSPVSMPMLLGALALALVEVMLARWASHAEIRPRRTAGAILTPRAEAAA